MPSSMPTASAMTFLIAPPSSTPARSVEVYRRRVGFIISSWIWHASSSFCEATTQRVGIPRATSSAWEGPDSTVTRAPGSSDRITSDMRINEPFSMPFARLTMRGAETTPRRAAATLRTAPEGTAMTQISAFAAQDRSVVSPICSGRTTPGEQPRVAARLAQAFNLLFVWGPKGKRMPVLKLVDRHGHAQPAAAENRKVSHWSCPPLSRLFCSRAVCVLHPLSAA